MYGFMLGQNKNMSKNLHLLNWNKREDSHRQSHEGDSILQ
jgi:hypothetical protein